MTSEMMTTIRISKEVRAVLKEIGEKGQSYDEVIRSLLYALVGDVAGVDVTLVKWKVRRAMEVA